MRKRGLEMLNRESNCRLCDTLRCDRSTHEVLVVYPAQRQFMVGRFIAEIERKGIEPAGARLMLAVELKMLRLHEKS